ncbi:MAG: chlorophyll synthesis pathway protein BchC [Acidocella sp. 20-63-7]|nr:MAG: chlorophyll synthesis pathway protein BchC [Acidocella sp. 20-63-7]
MDAQAVIIRKPRQISLDCLALKPAGDGDLVVQTRHSGVSTGTERLFWTGEMPDFPGMGYPLVPGYESVGIVVEAEGAARSRLGETVFVPGSNCFDGVRGLFGATASHLVVPARRAVTIPESLGERGVLLALAATAYHASAGFAQPELIVGHGVVGRLLARLAVLAGGKPVVWETNAARHAGAAGYEVLAPAEDPRRDYRVIYDASGDAQILDTLVQRLAPGGEIVLAGFYRQLGFAFAPAFMREARLRIAAQWQPEDLATVLAWVQAERLDLSGLITHRAAPAAAADAYETAFATSSCLKMLIDWNSK